VSGSSLPPLSHSEVRTWTTCRRQWALTYYWRWGVPPERVKPAAAMHLGTRVHLALEAWYGYGLDPLAVLEYEYNLAVNVSPEYEKELMTERGYATTMVAGYLEWAESEGTDADLEVLGTETDARAELPLPDGDSVTLRGHLDQLVRRRSDGAVLYRDWKTVGTFTKANNLAIDTQMRFYSLIQALSVKESGERADGGLYTMLLRSKRTARATPPFYQQLEIRYNRHTLNATWLRTRSIAQEIKEAHQRLDAGEDHHAVVYPSPGDHCNWQCPFLSVCPMMDDGSRAGDALKANFVRVDPFAHYEHDKINAIRRALGA
jgi:predicted thioesterase